MTGRIRSEESGWTLVELLIAAVLMIIVLSATLLAFNSSANLARGNALQNDQMDQLRPAMDRLIGQLRNVANPTTNLSSINYADATHLVFLTTDPTRRWVSYCLDYSSRTNERFIYQTSTQSTIQPQTSTTPCPSNTSTSGTPDWATQTVLSNNITNYLDSSNQRAIFTYAGSNGTIPVPNGGLSTIAQVSPITRIGATLYFDINAQAPPLPDKRPFELSLQSGAYLRNQNQPPTGMFTVLRGSGNSYTLDGSDSFDPEGRNLQYYWYETKNGNVAAVPSSSTQMPANALTDLPDCNNSQSAAIGGLTWQCLGVGVILSHDFSNDLPAYVWLRVIDPGNLVSLSLQPAAFANCTSISSTAPVRPETQCAKLP